MSPKAQLNLENRQGMRVAIDVLSNNIVDRDLVIDYLNFIDRVFGSSTNDEESLPKQIVPMIINILQKITNAYPIELVSMNILRKCVLVNSETFFFNSDLLQLIAARLKIHDTEEMAEECIYLYHNFLTKDNGLIAFDQNIITSLVRAMVMYDSNVNIALSSFGVLEVFGMTQEGKKTIISKQFMKLAFSFINLHPWNEPILTAALVLILLACKGKGGVKQLIQLNGLLRLLDLMKRSIFMETKQGIIK